MQPERSPFADQHYLNLETFRKSGVGVQTPVWFVEENGTIYVETPAQTGKIKRIRHNARVRVAPCDQRGNLKGEWIEAQARLIEGTHADQMARQIKQRYGWQYTALHLWGKLRRWNFEMIAIQIM